MITHPSPPHPPARSLETPRHPTTATIRPPPASLAQAEHQRRRHRHHQQASLRRASPAPTRSPSKPSPTGAAPHRGASTRAGESAFPLEHSVRRSPTSATPAGIYNPGRDSPILHRHLLPRRGSPPPSVRRGRSRQPVHLRGRHRRIPVPHRCSPRHGRDAVTQRPCPAAPTAASTSGRTTTTAVTATATPATVPPPSPRLSPRRPNRPRPQPRRRRLLRHRLSRPLRHRHGR